LKERHLIKDLFLRPRIFWALGILALLYVLSFHAPVLYEIATILLLFVVLAFIIDYTLLFFTQGKVYALRENEEVLSLGDENPIRISLQSEYAFPLDITIHDELPVQLQVRNFRLQEQLPIRAQTILTYSVRPTSRGEYYFGETHLYASSKIGLVQRRFSTEGETIVKVYPSYLKLKQYSIRGIAMRDQMTGSIKVKRGASTEFDQIRDYVRGDDVRRMNWKASARRNQLMINDYMDEKSQQVFCLIDKSRLMKMPFKGLSLLDYAINASLMFTYVALQKADKVGLITFSKQLDDVIKASKSKKQFSTIVERLYKQQTDFQESNYEAVQLAVRRDVGQRSLLFLFTNFETYVGFERKLPYFKMLNRKHLLCVILFENTALKSVHKTRGNDTEDIYIKTIADKYIYEKKMMLKELRKNGILSIYSAPEELSVNVVNKYLDLKSKRFI
jgi:uncharacterized protein (DUF58 family)